MNNKSHILEYFQKIVAHIATVYNSKIMALRSDRGGEYLSSDFVEFLQAYGIHRELTQAYTPSQNGVSKRKNQTLLEKACSMAFESHIPC